MNYNYFRYQLYVSILLTFTKHNLLCHAIETFYGDTSFKQFLTKFCLKPQLKTKLIFISNFNLVTEKNSINSSTNYTFQYKQLFENEKNDCLHFSHISTKVLNNFLKTNPHTNHKNLHIVFDFSQKYSQLNSTIFNTIINNLTPLFTTCKKCLPFMLLFKLSQSRLCKMSLDIFKFLPIHFRSVLIDISTSSVVFIRPVLNGCELLNNVFVAQNSTDFAKLKSIKCNLNTKQLKVSVNNVG